MVSIMYLKIYIEYADLLLFGKYISHIDIHRQLDLVSHYYVLEEKGYTRYLFKYKANLYFLSSCQ